MSSVWLKFISLGTVTSPQKTGRRCAACTDDGVNVDNGHNAIAVVVEIRFDHSHAIVGVRLIEGFAELMNKCT